MDLHPLAQDEPSPYPAVCNRNLSTALDLLAIASNMQSYAFLALKTVALLIVVRVLIVHYFPITTKTHGPPGLPLIGNMHQIPKTGVHHLLTRWAQQYGGLFTMRIGPSIAAVITDRRLVKELLDKRSAVYSARPASHVAQLITRGDHLLIMEHGETWRTMRRLIHQHLTESRVEREHIALLEAEQVQMARDFLLRPDQHMLHSKRTSNSIIMSLVFGVRTATVDAPHMRALYDLMERWSRVMEQGATPPVDLFPVLKVLPQALFGNWVQRSEDVGRRMKELYSGLHRQVLERRRRVGSQGSLMDAVLDAQGQPLTPNQLEFLGGVLIEGGSDTTSTMMLVFLQAMAQHPDVQATAQAQLDAVVGPRRMPRWSDFAALPYLNALVKEVMRWRPVTPLAFPHALARADTIAPALSDLAHPVTLPKGATVFLNVWGLHHDPAVFPDPDRFDPTRFLATESDGSDARPRLAAEHAASPDWARRDHYIYGAGRRICPGIHLAERSMWLGVATLLWGFNIGLARDRQGGHIPIETDPSRGYSEGFLVCPREFACDIRVRGDEQAGVIMREWERVEREVFGEYRK